ncbi:Brp/Blh family beta-carotene 15,15'-dioxygenase [Psychroflexus tropicus]|uniref:Brp/Blh family beta-carotene 15,15'-dioxygenase n=1 Tax=Psychroflexus tropicus TaxID=197345 RepID=UPI001FE1E0B8|nr:Brp/Blh family beta-carotene 15,15'-dioxygenase [Psychroflexus tropicus]
MLSLLALVASTALKSEILQVIALMGIFSFGILHGSNDLFVLQHLKQNNQQNNFLKALISYLGVVLGFVAIFYFIPLVALIAFVSISAYHFGEQHFHHQIKKQKSTLASLFYFMYGILVLFLLFCLNLVEVITIIEDMTGYTVPQPVFIYTLLTSSILTLGLYIQLLRDNSSLKKSIVSNLLYLVLFSALFSISSVIWGFATYFVLWHSLPSLKDQVNSLYGQFHWDNFIKYFKRAFPYWLASIIGMALLVYLFKDSKNFLSLLFAFIAAITFPHVFVMRKLFDRN